MVYKVDRLSRSLMDFLNIMNMLDKTGVSFVSVTQQFNTTSSMGRLTLNILLAFAQFEREIINLTNLAPEIQQAILDLEPTTDPVPRFREREVRTIAILPNWEKQRVLWKRLVKRYA